MILLTSVRMMWHIDYREVKSQLHATYQDQLPLKLRESFPENLGIDSGTMIKPHSRYTYNIIPSVQTKVLFP